MNNQSHSTTMVHLATLLRSRGESENVISLMSTITWSSISVKNIRSIREHQDYDMYSTSIMTQPLKLFRYFILSPNLCFR